MMFSPDQQAYDDPVLIRYLLGALPEAETERLDELSIANDEFAWRLRAVENDLVDAYVRGGLSGETLERFQTSYLSSANKREKVSFAEAFLLFADRAAPAPAVPVRRRSGSSLQRRAFQWGLAAAAVLMLLAGAYLLRENLGLQNQVARERAQRAALQQRAQELQNRLDEQPQDVNRQASQIGPPSHGLKTVSFVLLAQTRGAGQVATMVVPTGTDRVAVQLELESDSFAGYRAALKDPATNRIVWRGDRLKASSRGENRDVSISLPASLLHQQNYILELTGVSAAGDSELLGGYPFRVVIE